MTQGRAGGALLGAGRPSRMLWLLGLLLVAYGLLGLVILSGAALLVSAPLDRLAALGEGLAPQQASLVRTLRSTANTIDDAAAGFGGVDASLEQARVSSDRAAAISREVSATMHELGRQMNVVVLGVQPFASLAPSFERAGNQLDQLGTDLDGIGGALSRNSDDARTARENLERLGDEVDGLVAAVDGIGTELSLGSLDSLRLGIYGLLAWLAMMALASLLGGVLLLRVDRAARASGGGRDEVRSAPGPAALAHSSERGEVAELRQPPDLR